ncbi:hypothetical protein A7U43_12700 [Mycobacterium adipatum]|uniref:Uncharacterized protein n=1 Tax=Mycobacterium adipatum TaxID=1682113 RepID=A0A172ULG3_9MYCO|nr:hypothetical protein A7U43_12700 [Mycobacterium adipatum]
MYSNIGFLDAFSGMRVCIWPSHPRSRNARHTRLTISASWVFPDDLDDVPVHLGQLRQHPVVLDVLRTARLMLFTVVLDGHLVVLPAHIEGA